MLAACHSAPNYPPGGYDYPLQVPDKDTNFYYYPIRNKESRRDSFRDAWAYEPFRTLDEPNLSLRPMGTDVFRFSYDEALDPDPIIITLTPDEIVVKTGRYSKDLETFLDTNRLTPLERRLVKVLDHNYPLDEKDLKRSKYKQHYLDSLGRLYPQLYDPAYYFSLWKKEWPQTKSILTYTVKKIRITRADFDHLVATINASGYWQLPVRIPCVYETFDGWGYTLEANTASKYNIVNGSSCDADTSRFTKACQELVHYAGLEKRIHLVFEAKADTTKYKPLVIHDVLLEDVKEPPRKRKHKK